MGLGDIVPFLNSDAAPIARFRVAHAVSVYHLQGYNNICIHCSKIKVQKGEGRQLYLIGLQDLPDTNDTRRYATRLGIGTSGPSAVGEGYLERIVVRLP